MSSVLTFCLYIWSQIGLHFPEWQHAQKIPVSFLIGFVLSRWTTVSRQQAVTRICIFISEYNGNKKQYKEDKEEAF